MISVLSALAGPALPVEGVTSVHVGSCAYSRAPRHPTWRAMRENPADLVVLLGDVVYANTEDPAVLTRTLGRLGRRKSFGELRAQTPILHTWDDHDYGENDSDRRHADREGVREATLDFFGASETDPRRSQPGGIYGSWTFGTEGQRVQVVLLDTRWDLDPRQPRTDGGVGRYEPGEGHILGQAQWAWLERTLQQPAELRLIGSSIPFAAEYTGWETWSNFPAEQERLDALLRGAGPILVVSGDVHYSELSARDGVFDFTSSGLAIHPYGPLPNKNRVGGFVRSMRHQYGTIAIHWEAAVVELELRNQRNRVFVSKRLTFAELDPP